MRNAAGVTLIELLVAIATLAIVLGFSVPAFSVFLHNNRRAASLNGLVAQLNYARQVALSRGDEVVVCPSADRLRCDRSFDWAGGWIGFVNLDGDDPPVRDDNEPLLRSSQGLPAGLSLTANLRYSTFQPLGRSSNGTWTLCDRRNAREHRAVILSTTGRVRQSRTKPDGTALDC